MSDQIDGLDSAVTEGIDLLTALAVVPYPLPPFKRRIQAWHDYTLALLSNALHLPEEVIREFRSTRGFSVPRVNHTEPELLQWLESAIQDRIAVLTSIRRRLVDGLIPISVALVAPRAVMVSPIIASKTATNDRNTDDPAVFLVHGHDVARLRDAENFLRRIVGEVIVLADEPGGSRTVIEQFEGHAQRAAFAVALLTGDDEGKRRNDPGPSMPRGRQNVIFEIGYFFAHLGRGRVAVLYEEGVELPSDIAGLRYLGFHEQWTEKLRMELSKAGVRLRE